MYYDKFSFFGSAVKPPNVHHCIVPKAHFLIVAFGNKGNITFGLIDLCTTAKKEARLALTSIRVLN